MKQSIAFFLALLLCLAVYSLGLAQTDLPQDLLEMKIRGVTMDPNGPTPIVILEALEGHQAFPIWIGMNEAQAIAFALEGTLTPRPLTHKLLGNILTDLQVKVVRIVVHDLRNDTFYASISLQQGQTTSTIDARPSDAIALALEVKAPIFVTPKVLQSTRTVTLAPSPASELSTQKFGMHMQSLDAKLARIFHLDSTDGVLVAFVEEGSQAARHGIRRGDVITDVDGRHITSMDDLLITLKESSDGQEIVLQVMRDEHPKLIRLRLSGLE